MVAEGQVRVGCRHQKDDLMLKLTRLNNHVVAINPDHIQWADSTPDTTLFLIGGEKIIVRETLEELIDAVIRFRRLIREGEGASGPIGDPPRFGPPPRPSEIPARLSLSPISRRGGR
jgi:flagellar protein FlbD